ncbi:MIT C-terminal domain-containing protein [Jiella pelagia]
MECRKRVKDQLFRIDSTYPDVDFHYVGLDGKKRMVATVEEEEYPQFYGGGRASASEPEETSEAAEPERTAADTAPSPLKLPEKIEGPKEGHLVFAENRKGISYEKLFGAYVDGASRIVVTDPYIRIFYQIRNMMEFVEMVVRRKPPEDQVEIHLVTGPDDGGIAAQRELLDSISEAATGTGVVFSWAFDGTGTAHARDITTDTGWKIVLDRGLDIFQPPVRKPQGFSLGDRLQEHRMIKGFYVTYVRNSGRL